MIIKTPQPDIEERLVVVPPESCTPYSEGGKPIAISVRAQSARYATPDDLARAGYVLAEETREDGSVVPVRRWENGIRAIASIFIGPRDEFEVSEIVATVKALRARAEKVEGLLVQRETELRLAREDGAAVERQMREARSAADASFVRAEKADALLEAARAEFVQAARERDEAREFARVLTVERDDARAELARLTAPAKGSLLSNGELVAAIARGDSYLQEAYRLGVAHERARHARTEPRATDEELVAIGHAVGKTQTLDGLPEGRGNTWEAWHKECDLAIVRAARLLGEVGK